MFQRIKYSPLFLTTSEIKTFSNIINRTSTRILNQLNELVDWAKKQHEKSSFNPTKIQLIKGVNESLELLKNSASQKDIHLVNEISETFYVKADRLMLRSILQNIVTNAIKFTPQGGTVTASAKAADSMIEICILDTGVGMTKELKEKLFQDASYSISGTNNEQGSGLGLILVRDFVAQHGGSITVESEINRGTCFRFTIPAA